MATLYEPPAEWQRGGPAAGFSAPCSLDARTLAFLDDRRPPSGSFPYGGTGGAPSSMLVTGPSEMVGPTGFGSAEEGAGVSRQLRACMTELSELRKALVAEREARASLVASAMKKLKEEVQIDIAASEVKARASFAEIDAVVTQKLQAAEHARALERKRQEDGSRGAKFQERQYRETAEALREEMNALGTKVEGALAVVKQTRVEINQQLENERGAQVARMELELQRYEERSRQRDCAMQEVRASVTKEMLEVQKLAREYVRHVWDERMESLTRHVNDKLGNMKQAQDMQTGIIVDIGNKMLATRDEMKVELQEGIKDLKMRVHAVEVDGPILNTRMDRFDRKADVLLERTNANDQILEGARTALEKVQGTMAKMNDRLVVAEQTVVDVEARTERLDRACVVLQHVDVNRQAIDNLRKDVERLNYSIGSVKEIADNDEKVVDTMRRVLDAACDRVDAAEKKVAKVASRFEGCEQLVSSFKDRMSASEATADALQASLEQQALSLKEAWVAVEKAARKGATLAEKVDQGEASWRAKTASYDMKLDKLGDRVGTVETAVYAVTAGIDRSERRISSLDSTCTSVADQVMQFSQVIEVSQRELQAMDKKAQELRGSVERAERSLESRLQDILATVTAVQDKTDTADRRYLGLIDASDRRLSERMAQIEGTSASINEKSKERDRQVLAHDAILQRLESELLSEAKETRARLDRARTQAEDLTRALEAASRAADSRVDATERAVQGLSQKLGSLQSVSTLNSETLIEIRRRVDLLEARGVQFSPQPLLAAPSTQPTPAPAGVSLTVPGVVGGPRLGLSPHKRGPQAGPSAAATAAKPLSLSAAS
eukprot:RCo039503